MAVVTDASGALDAGRAALACGAWGDAVAAFSRVVDAVPADDARAAEAWEGIGLASYWRDDPTRAIEAHERAFAAYRDLQQPALAARMALWLADDHMTFLNAAAVANGWIERAERLLQDAPDAVAHAWLPIYRGHYVLQVEFDAERAGALAREGLARARALGAPDAEVVGLALEGLSLVFQGNASAGLPRLDEASAAAVSRGLGDLNAVAWALCYLIQGCETIRDFHRATEWCARVLAFCERWGLGPVFTSCRTRYASVLTWQGHWESAETQIRQLLSTAHAPGQASSARRSALVRLGEVRRRQGRLDEAEMLFDEAGEHRLAILGRASIALARDELDVAGDLADRVLRLLPRDARAERADALLVRIVAAARRGEVVLVQDDLQELTDTAERLATAPLLGAAAYARGAVSAARREPAAALAAFEDALAHYDRGGAPHEAAQVRLELAVVLKALGRDATARREAAQARDTFARLGAQADLERAERFLGPVVDQASPAIAIGLPLTRRELEVLRLVGSGLANADIARRLRLSPHTVKRHIANILRKLDSPSRAAAVAKASRLGAL
jgi:DNA-binding CsgD family transcriptional regulator